MNGGQFILRRLAQMIPVLIGITLIVFSLLQLIPGDPAVTMLGLQTRPEAVAALRHELGLDRPNHLFLPALTIALSIVPFLVRSLRASILKTMAADYVRTARDYPLVQSTTLVFAFLVIAINLLTDVIYTFLDPRVRL